MKKLRVISVFMALAMGLAVFALTACSTHEHTLTKVAASPAYCRKEGNIEYWKCEECGKYFADAEATQEITLEETVIPYAHQLRYVEAITSEDVFTCDASAHYVCEVCGDLFADEAATQSMAEGDVYQTKTFSLTEASITDVSTGAKTERFFAVYNDEELDLAVTEKNFVMRVFLGWEGADLAALAKQGNTFRANLNIDTVDNLAAGKWMSFRVGYDALGGYGQFSDSNIIRFPELSGGGKLTLAMQANGGLYVTIVHSGGLVTAYGEDSDGNLVKIGESESFSDSALVKCTLGVHMGYYASEEHPVVLKSGKLVIGTTDAMAAR